MKLRGGVLVGAAGEDVGDLIMGGEKPLHLSRRLEALHDGPRGAPARLGASSAFSRINETLRRSEVRMPR
jgi:hypothetical protein